MTTEIRHNPKRSFTKTLIRDPRWQGPYLAAALLFGIQTGPDGTGWYFQYQTNANGVGVTPQALHQVAEALIEQGYLSRIDNPEVGAYRIDATRPAAEISAADSPERMTEVGSLAPATRWLYEQTQAWRLHERSRTDHSAESARR